MDDVAGELGISKKTLYQYFKDKADLVSQVVDYYMKSEEFNLNSFPGGNAIDRLFALRQHILNILKHYNNSIEYDLKKLYPKLHRKVHKAKRERIFSSTLENLTDGIKSGHFRNDFDVEMVAKLVVGRMLYTMNPENEIFTESEIASIDLFDKLLEYHMHAICTSEGLKYYKEQLNIVKNESKN